MTTSLTGAFGRLPLRSFQLSPPLVVLKTCAASSPFRKPENVA